MTQFAEKASHAIREQIKNFTPRIAIILGSGSGALAEQIVKPHIIPYRDLPGFHATTVAGHKGNLYLGELNGVPVACLQGRPHYYEGVNPQTIQKTIQTMIRTLKLLGCDYLITTNAVGSLRKSMPPGSLVLIKDHINFQFHNVLVGENLDIFGPRFPSLQAAYDPVLREKLWNSARKLNIKLKEGVYMAVLGPTYETPAEINAYRILGADVVGMSLVPEVMVARHCGMRVASIAVVTNFAAGLARTKITHEEALDYAGMATTHIISLITNWVQGIDINV